MTAAAGPGRAARINQIAGGAQMAARSRAHNAPSQGEGGDGARPVSDEDGLLLAALLDGMDAALCAFDAHGVVTHWNREAERILGWSHTEAVGRKGLGGWAVRAADAAEIEQRLLAARDAPGRQVHECALQRKDGGRVLVRVQSCGVSGGDGAPTGVYCAFSEVHTQIDLERSLALSDALLAEAPWGVVLVDADLRPTALNPRAVTDFGLSAPSGLLGRPLGDVLEQGVEELENALQLVLAEGPPPQPGEIWVTLREPRTTQPERAEVLQSRQRCWQSGFLLLSSPLAEEHAPLGAAWFFRDVTEAKRQAQQHARLRFRAKQTQRAARVAAESGDPMEAATTHLEFALAGFADHAVLDLLAEPSPARGGREDEEPSPALLRAALTPPSSAGAASATGAEGGLPVGYAASHPAVQALRRTGPVRASLPGEEPRADWAAARRWPPGTMHGLCVLLRNSGRTLGVATFLRGAGRPPFDRTDLEYAEDVGFRVAAAVALAGRPEQAT